VAVSRGARSGAGGRLGVALPPDAELKADLASYVWQNTTGGILLEDKEADQKKRIGRSPDKGDAVVMCLAEGDRAVEREQRRGRNGGRGPVVNLGHSKLKAGRLR
jgi:hypothetical protein